MPALRAFAASLDCALVVTQPDRPAGRGNKVQPTPVKRAARELGIATIEPTRLRDSLETLRQAAADVFGVASYGKIVPQAILDLAPRGALNVHPSLLPLYRGATPLQTQLRDGVTDGGVTIILMDAGMDTGDIVLQERTAIGAHETYGDLHDRLAVVGAALLARACAALASGTLTRRPQTGLASEAEIARTTTRPLRKDDWKIGSYASLSSAYDYANFVRSLAPAPAARIAFHTFESVKVLEATPLAEPGPQLARSLADGEVVVASGTVLVKASDGWLRVDELALPGGKPMSAAAFRNGYPLTLPNTEEDALHAWSQSRMKAAL